jgi:hypothetical protein
MMLPFILAVAVVALGALGAWRAMGGVRIQGDHRWVWYTPVSTLRRDSAVRGFRRALDAARLEGRLFEVPATGGMVTMDDVETWLGPTCATDGKHRWADGRRWLRVREHLLALTAGARAPDAVEAVVFEFTSAEDRQTFEARIPHEGPARRRYVRMPSLEEQAMYN